MVALKEPVKIFIVQSLACFETPQQVADAVEEIYKIKIDRKQCHSYDPSKYAGRNLSKNLKDLFVTVTAGHSNKDPGAVNGKYKEAELVRQFRNAVTYYLYEAGIQYKTDGIGTLNQDLNSAIKLIKGSSVAVEFHMNAAVSKQANDIETIVLPKDKKLAQDLSKAVAGIFGSRLSGDNSWIDQSQSARGKIGFISNGGLIMELGFISNESDLAQFNAKYWTAAKAVAKVLIEYEKRN